MLTEFRPLPLLFARSFRRWRRSQTSPRNDRKRLSLRGGPTGRRAWGVATANQISCRNLGRWLRQSASPSYSSSPARPRLPRAGSRTARLSSPSFSTKHGTPNDSTHPAPGSFVPRPNVPRKRAAKRPRPSPGNLPYLLGWFPKEGPQPFLWSFQGVSGGNTKSPRESFLGSARRYSFDLKRISHRKPPTFVGGSPRPQGAVYLAFDGRIKAPRCRQASLALPGQQTET